jgi:hypothetical protein
MVAFAERNENYSLVSQDVVRDVYFELKQPQAIGTLHSAKPMHYSLGMQIDWKAFCGSLFYRK